MNETELDANMEQAMNGFDEMERALFERGVNWAFDQLLREALDRASIVYSEDLICECLSDGFKAGFIARSEELDSLKVVGEPKE